MKDGSEEVAAVLAKTVHAGEGWAWFPCGWRLFAKNPGSWIAMLLIFFVINIVLGLIPFIGTLAGWLLQPLLAGGLMYAAHELDSGRQLDISYLFQAFRDKQKLNPLLSVGALALVANLGILILFVLFLGSSFAMAALSGGELDQTAVLQIGATGLIGLLLVLALALLVMMALLYAPALVMLGGMEPVAAIKSSFAACLHNWLALFVFSLVWLVLAIAAAIPFGLGFIILVPVTVCCLYCSYKDIYGLGESALPA